jgi:hypothetical protein
MIRTLSIFIMVFCLAIAGCGGGSGPQDDAGNEDAGVDAGADVGPGDTDPGDTDPGDTDPGDNDPGDTDPGDNDPDGGDTGPDPGLPRFGGVSLAYSPDIGMVTLEWLAAVDDTTDPVDMRYLVFHGDTIDLVAQVLAGQSADATLTGENAYTFEGLTPDQETFFLVLAEDADGNWNENLRITQVTPLAESLVFSSIPKDLASMDLTVTENGLNDFTLSGTDAPGIAVDDIIILDNTFGRNLRMVTASDVNGNDNHILTEKASLSEIIESGTLRTSVSMADSEPTGRRRMISLTDPLPLKPTIQNFESSDGRIRSETRDYGRPYDPELSKRGLITLEDGVTLEYTVTFEAALEAEARWTDSVVDYPNYVKGLLRGTLSVDAKAAYNIDGAVEYKANKTLFSKTFNFTYVVGVCPACIPVLQDVTLEFIAELEFKAEASLTMEATGHAEKMVAIGFEWDEAGGFRMLKEEGSENVITFNVEGKAGAKGVLKVYPKASTSLYKAARVTLYVVPQIILDAAARLIPLPMEITKFDVDFLVQAYGSVDLTILGKELAKWESAKYELFRLPIHSQPELNIRHSKHQLDTCGTRKLFLSVADGYNNEVPNENISWELDDPDAGGNLEITNNGITADFTAEEAGDYTINVSAHGDGFLGFLGTRYASTTINVVEAPPDDCDPANSQGGPDDCIACFETYWGFNGVPVPHKTTIMQGEQLVWDFPIVCLGGCRVYGGVHHETIGTGLNNMWGDYGIAVGEEEIVTGQSSYGHELGYYYNLVQIEHDLESGGGGHGTVYNGGSNGTYSVWAQIYRDWPDSTEVETCEGDSGIPAIPIRVVKANDRDDGNEEPEDAVHVEINGPKVSSQIRFQDDDWFRVSPTVEDHYGAVYDSDRPYDPNCWLVYEAPGQTLYLYGSLEDAEAEVNLLAYAGASYGKIIYGNAVPDKDYYVLIRKYDLRQDYIIEVTSDCQDLDAGFPRLTAAPVLSADTITPGDPLTVTLEFTPNVTRANVRFGRMDNPVMPITGDNFPDLDGLDTLDAVLETDQLSAGEHFIRVMLIAPGTTYISEYKVDLNYSDEYYIVESTDYQAPSLQTNVTEILIPVLTVTE